ncbi:MAG: flagellar motor switch protein FliN [Chitinispirillaceae bacterium]|nr:flagellar motor switch protein FliN [Chitinispirillaceae bacterium]
MSDILSQEQIDALLNAQGFESDGGGELFQENPTDLYSLLLKTFDYFCEQASTVISTVLNRKVVYHSELCEQAAADTIQEKLPSVLLALKIGIKGALEGEFYLLFQKTNVAVLSDLMMMGDGSAEYTEDHKDAISELFNQVMGAFTTTLTGELGSAVNSDSIETVEFDLDNPPFSIDSQEMLLISQTIEEMPDTFVVILVPKEFSAQIGEKMKEIAAPIGGGTGDDGVGLNMNELDDLSKVTSFSGGDEGGFHETRMPMASGASQQNIEMLLDIDLDVNIELGQSMLSIKRILELAPGAIVELDRMAGEPVDLMVNKKVVARGEVVVIDENFGIRIVSLVSPEERIRSLR